MMPANKIIIMAMLLTLSVLAKELNKRQRRQQSHVSATFEHFEKSFKRVQLGSAYNHDFVNSPQTETFILIISQYNMQPYTQSVCILTRCCQSICPRQDGSVQGDRTHLRLYTASLWCAPSAHAIGTTSLNEISLLFSFQFKLGHIPSTNRFLRPFESKMCDSCGETFSPFRDRVCQMLWNTVLTDFQILNARLPLKKNTSFDTPSEVSFDIKGGKGKRKSSGWVKPLSYLRTRR